MSAATSAAPGAAGQPGRPAGVQVGQQRLERGHLDGARRRPAGLGRLGRPLGAPGRLVAVGQDELEVHRLGVGRGVDALLGCGTSALAKARTTWIDGVHLAQTAERLPAEPLAAARRRPGGPAMSTT